MSKESKKAWFQWSTKNSLLLMILLSLLGIIIALYMKCKPVDKSYKYYENNQKEREKESF